MSKVKVMVSLPEDLLAEVDRVAKEEDRNRSELLREAVRLYLEVRRVRKAVAIQDALARQDTLEDWDSTAEIRRWREGR
jgi:metal-responsive CopG/Arc/MetJ family transcriptional regulator